MFQYCFYFLKNIFFPQRCVICNQDTGAFICSDCYTSIKYQPKKENYSYICFPIYTIFACNYITKKLIFDLKYKYFFEIGNIFRVGFDDSFAKLPKKSVIIPVPLHKSKKKKRGSNHITALLPKTFPILTIQRTKNTQAQKDLSKQDRVINVQNAFICRHKLEPQNTYIIVDDIVTTGSTIQEVADSLKKAGAKKILALCLIRYEYKKKKH